MRLNVFSLNFLQDLKGRSKYTQCPALPRNEVLSISSLKVFEKLLNRPSNLVDRIKEALRFLAVNLQPITMRELWKYTHLDLYSNLDGRDEIAPDAEVDIFRGALGSLVATYAINRRFIGRLDGGDQLIRQTDTYVELCHSSLRQMLLKEGGFYVTGDAQKLLEVFSCDSSIAHRNAALACLRIARSSFKWPICYSYYALKGYEPDMVQYAWDYWFSHLLAANCLEDETARGIVSRFWDELLDNTIVFLGSISHSVTNPRINIGPDAGGITKSAGLVDLQKALMASISGLEALHSNGNMLARWTHINIHWKEQLSCKRNSNTIERCQAWLWWYRHRSHYSAVAAEISFWVRQKPYVLAEIRTSIAPTIQAVQSLQDVATSLCINPVRWDHLPRCHGFSAIAPILYASFTLESIMLWPISDTLPVTSIRTWNLPARHEALKVVRWTVSELEKEPSAEEIEKRLREAKKFHRMPGKLFLTIGTYVELFQGEGLTQLFRAPFLNYWLNRNVHVATEFTRGVALVGYPARSFRRAISPNLEAKLPDILAAIAAFPVQFALLAARLMQHSLSQAKWYLWPLLRWNHARLRLAYINYANVPKQFWLYRRQYLLPALLLYILRNRYFPSFGQHWQPNAYSQVKTAMVSPLDWIDHLSRWTWWDLVRYYTVYSIAGGAFMLIHWMPPSPSNRLLYVSCESYSALWLFLILERTTCQVINAILAISVPIALLIQPRAMLAKEHTHTSFRKEVIDPLLDIGTTVLLMVGIRMAIPLLIIYFTGTEGVFLSLVKQAFIGVSAALTLSLAILLAISTLKTIFRPDVLKDSASLFLMSLVAAGMVFLILEVLWRVENDPWGLNEVWEGYSTVVRKAEKLTGSKIKTLQANINEHLAELPAAVPESAQPPIPTSSPAEEFTGSHGPAYDLENDPWDVLEEG